MFATIAVNKQASPNVEFSVSKLRFVNICYEAVSEYIIKKTCFSCHEALATRAIVCNIEILFLS